ncbi:hypothetical protein OH76DRAFT_1423478, partial [Lentinus brumalis]
MSSKRPSSHTSPARSSRLRRRVDGDDEQPDIKKEKGVEEEAAVEEGEDDDVVSVAYSEDARIVDDINDDRSVIAEDGETVVWEGDQAHAAVAGEPAAVDPEELVFDIWVDPKSLRNIRRYVQTYAPQEAMFSLAMVPLDNCTWLPDGSLGYQEVPVRLRTVGTVVGQAFHADVLHYPEFVCRIELARGVDKTALRRIYHTCVPHKPVPPYFEAYKRYGQHSSTFESVFNSPDGVRAGALARTLPFTSVLIGSVVLVESTVRRI